MKHLHDTASRHAAARFFARLIPNVIRGAQLDFFAKKKVKQTQFVVLMSVHSFGRCSMSHLARSLHVTMPTMTGVVDRLIEAGYLRRLAHPRDRRQVVAEMTAKGRGFAEDFQAMLEKRWNEVLEALTHTEVDQLNRILQKMLLQFRVGTKRPM